MSASSDADRRFDEFPHALAAAGRLRDLARWTLSEDTLAYASRNGRVESLTRWYDLAAEHAAGRALPGRDDFRDWGLDALRGLRELAYQSGLGALEAEALAAQRGRSGLSDCGWLIESSLMHYRRGDQAAAEELAQFAVGTAVAPRDLLAAKMNLVQMLAFGDAPAEAHDLARRIPGEAGEILSRDREAEAFCYQYLSLASHFLDLNQQSYDASIRACEIYSALGRRYDQGISLVNAGDGAWGMGNHAEAERCFDEALGMAARYRLPHVEDIALICLGNLRMSQRRLDEADALYSRGVALAERISQRWDVLYGRIYHALTRGLLGQFDGSLQPLIAEATASGYRYLADLARAHLAVLGLLGPADVVLLSQSPFPGPRAYAIAYRLRREGCGSDELRRVIDASEGLKGPFFYVEQALTGNQT